MTNESTETARLKLPDREAYRDDAEQRWTSRSEWPLAAAAAVFLAAYAWPILQPDLTQRWKDVCIAVVYVVWVLFGLDYLIRLALATSRWNFVRHNFLDLASIALPVLRPLRLLRLIALVRVLNRKATTSLHGRVAIYVTSSGLLIIFVASLAVLDAERNHAGANIHSFGNALWWAATTVTTVGYGDHVPVTATGRYIAVGLMIGGITLLGIVTASMATWLIARVRDVETGTEDRMMRRIDDLQQDIAELKTIIADFARQHADPDQPARRLTGP